VVNLAWQAPCDRRLKKPDTRRNGLTPREVLRVVVLMRVEPANCANGSPMAHSGLLARFQAVQG